MGGGLGRGGRGGWGGDGGGGGGGGGTVIGKSEQRIAAEERTRLRSARHVDD